MTPSSPDSPQWTEIRRPGPEDAEALARLDARCFPPDVAFSTRTFRRLLGSAGAFGRLIDDPSGTGPVGAIIALTSVAPDTVTEIVTIDVDPRYRRRGLATTLLDGCVDDLDAAGGGLLSLHVAPDNHPARSLYRKRGFRTVRLVPGYYGQRGDALLMIYRVRDRRNRLS